MPNTEVPKFWLTGFHNDRFSGKKMANIEVYEKDTKPFTDKLLRQLYGFSIPYDLIGNAEIGSEVIFKSIITEH
jgi:hypothetical protein